MENFEEHLDKEPSTLTQQSGEAVIDKTTDSNIKSVDDSYESRETLKPRNYQLEMAEESSRRNIIVALDTGSGKTQIAVIRIRAELERTLDDKLVWFLAPTLALCHQQYRVLQNQIPHVQIKFLSGNDGVDKWSEQSLWDGVLQNVRIVVSTHDILLDALTHAFVTLDRLTLIVIDEAHNCVKAHPGAQIMRNFYHPRKAQNLPVPHILGLTASPIMNSMPKSLEKIEQTLDAICRTPTQHRAEVLQYVRPPKVLRVDYTPMAPKDELHTYTPTLHSLQQVYVTLDIMQDPEILYLKGLQTDRGRRSLQDAIEKKKSYCQEQIKSFYLTSLEICHELGAWAADVFVARAISAFVAYVEDADSDWEEGWKTTSRIYTAYVLKQVYVIQMDLDSTIEARMVSPKVEAFIDLLLQEKIQHFAGIAFVQQRATVAMLAHLLSVHSRTKGMFTIGTFVGTSKHSRREASINDLLDIHEQKDTLEDFKGGSRNLIIATSVLEEGIDVSACAFVVSFSRPANLKAYIQRRGRARKLDSKIAVMISSDEVDNLKKWHELEDTMRKMYEDQLRELKVIEEQEQEDEEEYSKREFLVQSTGAYLDLNNAVSHLHHFCSTVTASQHVDTRPDIYCENDGHGKIRANIVLPLSIDASLRFSQSKLTWKSERNAIKDAAFEAYIALYNGGLINENLMPLLRYEARNLFASGVEKRPSIVEVPEQINPWVMIADLWIRQSPAYTSLMTVRSESGQILYEMQVILPVTLPQISPTKIYCDADTTFVINMTASTTQHVSPDVLSDAILATKLMIDAAFGHRFPDSREDFAALFVSKELLEATRKVSSQPLVEFSQVKGELCDQGLIRDNRLGFKSNPFVFGEWLDSRPDNISANVSTDPQSEDILYPGPHVVVSQLPRRTNMLREVNYTVNPVRKYALPITACTIGNLPFKYVQFAMCSPSILHLVEIHLVAMKLNKTIFSGNEFHDLDLVLTAISSPNAIEQNNYQRLEFLGDSCLKLCVTLRTMSKELVWHESYLSAERSRLTSNSRLARVALDLGLDKFILTKKFSGAKRKPLYNHEILSNEILSSATLKKREMSTKVLADVVEALLGAAMIEGGIPKVLFCLQLFFPEIEWISMESCRDILYNHAPSEVVLPPTLQPLETLTGYTFKRKSLLIDAMTHASSQYGTSTYERLEFLGDAILEIIVTNKVFAHKSEISVGKMDLIRAAVVNADVVAFFCLEWSISQETVDILENKLTKTFKEKRSRIKRLLWEFMRHNLSDEACREQAKTISRYKAVREEIISAITSGTCVPWMLFIGINANKWYSDLIESLLGAIYIDSGSISACEEMLERMGLLSYLRRILDENLETQGLKLQLSLLASPMKVEYIMDPDVSNEDLKNHKLFTCELFVGEKSIVKVDGPSKSEAMNRAADKAIKSYSEWKDIKSRNKSGQVVEAGTDEVMDEVGGVDEVNRLEEVGEMDSS